MPPDTYFLPEGYKTNTIRTTIDSERDDVYWYPRRLNDSFNYQYFVYKYAIDIIKKHNLKRAIDVGCGPGVKLPLLHKEIPGLQITGIDQEHPIQYCKNHHDFGQWYVDDFENPRQDIPDFEADLVINADVIEHVINPDMVLSYLARRCAPGGYVIISTPDREQHFGSGKMEPGNKDHIREWSKAEFASYLKSRNWKVLDHFHQLGIRPSISHAYLRTLASYVLKKNPKSLRYNQVVLAQPPQ